MTTVKISLRNAGITQHHYPTAFNSFAVFQGIPLGAGPDGIFRLDGGLKDVFTTGTDEREVVAWFELPMSQLGMDYVKQGRRIYLGGEFSGAMWVKVTTETGENTYTATPQHTDLSQHTLQIPLKHTHKGEWMGFTVGNTAGADFSVDLMDGTFIKVNRRLGK